MKKQSHQWSRRAFLGRSVAGISVGPFVNRLQAQAEPVIELNEAHRAAVNRRRRITVQYDGYNGLGKDWQDWLDYRFRWIDEPGVQIDSVWWDIQPLLKNRYPTPPDSLIYQWPDEKTDIVERLIEETRKRGLEVFWNHRISEVDLKPPGGKGWTKKPHPLKAAHPDWVMKTWWPHGLWNLENAEVRDYKVGLLRHLAETYPLDGFQLDFARHVPCLPVGRQWELRHHVTRFVRQVREMTLEAARKRGRPILLAARVPRSLEGCRVDGFDIETWAQQNLLDILSLGSRSLEVEIEAYRKVIGGRNIKLQPCCDDHHAADGYRCPPIEVFRGIFSNWREQGADSVMTFNWACADPELCGEMGGAVAPLSQLHAYREVGDPATLKGRDKTFVVERRGGYPWADGYFNRNDDSPLPQAMSANGSAVSLTIRLADPIRDEAGRIRSVTLAAIFFGATETDRFDILFNGAKLTAQTKDPDWKDPQIFSPKATPASGGRFDRYRVNPKQKLLRIECQIDPQTCRVGKNQIEIRRSGASDSNPPAKAQLEKLEVELKYKS